MWFSYKYFRVNYLHSLDERDSPSKFRVSTPALLYNVLPQSYQDVDIITLVRLFLSFCVVISDIDLDKV